MGVGTVTKMHSPRRQTAAVRMVTMFASSVVEAYGGFRLDHCYQPHGWIFISAAQFQNRRRDEVSLNLLYQGPQLFKVPTMNINNSTIVTIAIAMLVFVLGFAYGNVFDAVYGFHLKDWQTLVSAIIAILIGLLAFFGVRNTQRITVMIKEEERIDTILPGLRQAEELLRALQRPLRALRPQTRHESQTFVNSVFGVDRDEGLEVAVRRSLSLADERLRGEVVRHMFALRNQAVLLKIKKEEMDQSLMDLSERDQFSPEMHPALCTQADKAKEDYEREGEKMGVSLDALDRFVNSIEQRISEAEKRRVIVRKVLDRFFVTNGD
jgi:hypothetical protein